MDRENNKPKVVRKTDINVVELNRLRNDFNRHIENHPSGGDSSGGNNSTCNIKFRSLGNGETVEIIK